MGDLKKENGKPLMGLLLVTVAPIYLSVAFLHWEWLAATASGWTLEADVRVCQDILEGAARPFSLAGPVAGLPQ